MITLFIINVMIKLLSFMLYASIIIMANIIDFLINFVFGFITSFVSSFIREYRIAKKDRYKQTITSHEEIKLLTVGKYH